MLTLESANELVERLDEIEVPYKRGYVSQLGGPVSVIITISKDNRDHWKSEILENSRYAKFHIQHDGTIEMISRGDEMPKFRKSRATSIKDVISKINRYLVAEAPKRF